MAAKNMCCLFLPVLWLPRSPGHACATRTCRTACCRRLDYACKDGESATASPSCRAAPTSPNELKAHCSYAVNSFCRRKNMQACVFSGTAPLTNSDPSGNRCTYPTNQGAFSSHVMNYQDTMSICRVYGPPDFFVTFTCNTKWREIADAPRYKACQQPCDQSDLIVRVFHRKVNEFIEDIREGKKFAALYIVDFQKRGLPHLSCLVWLAGSRSEFSASMIDGFICGAADEVAKKLFAGEEAGDDSGKTRSRPSTDKKIAKKLFPGEEEEAEDGVAAADQTSSINNA